MVAQLKTILGEHSPPPSDEIEGFKTFLDPWHIVGNSRLWLHKIVGRVKIKAPWPMIQEQNETGLHRSQFDA